MLVSYEDVREFIREYLSRKLKGQGRGLPADFSEDCDLLLSGIIDSLGLLELIMEIQEHCACEIDFESLNPELMTVVRPLCEFVADQTRNAVS